MKPLKARMAEIPAIIDSKQSTLAEYEQIDYESILKEIESKKADIEQIDAAILGQGKAIEPIMGERNRIYDLINDKSMMLYEAKIAHNNRETAKISAVKSRLDEAKRGYIEVLKRNEGKKANHEAMVRDLEAVKLLLSTYEQTREKLLAERDAIKARVFTEESCAYCGQELPYEKQEEARARFNTKKQKDLEDVVARGKANNVSIENHKEKITYLEAEIAKGYTLEETPDTLALETEYKEAQSAFVPFESTSEYARLSKEIDDLKATLPAIPTNDNEALTNAKRMLIGELETLNRRYGLKSKADAIREEIVKLQAEQRQVGSEIARLEGKIDKCKEYAQEKADIISYRVNGKMNNCKIEMWSTQKDGCKVPDVIILGKNGVKYSTLNFSDRIKTCIELQRLFMEKYEVSLPIWIDEYSIFSLDNAPIIQGQSILLSASNDIYLTVETK
jgi:chromosome segregation ATPase